MTEKNIYKGIIEDINKKSARLVIYAPEHSCPKYIVEVPIKALKKIKANIRAGACIEMLVDEDINKKTKPIKLIRELPIGHLSEEELAREEARLEEAFRYDKNNQGR